MEPENKSYTVTQYMKALKQKVESTPAVWVRGVITQINEKSKVVYLSIADFEDQEPPGRIPAWRNRRRGARGSQGIFL